MPRIKYRTVTGVEPHVQTLENQKVPSRFQSRFTIMLATHLLPMHVHTYMSTISWWYHTIRHIHD